jgi:FkbM family methyltransferase
MAFGKMKSIARVFGMYRMARWVYRHIINREELRVFREELAFYTQFLHPGCLCFDIGANIGAKTEIFLKLGARVIAFEPQSECIKELHSRLGANARLVTINAAVGSCPGQATLFTRGHSTCSSLLEEWEGVVEDTVEVQVTTLDDSLARYGVPQYCKIDVEGFELEVIKGLSRPIPILSFEYHLASSFSENPSLRRERPATSSTHSP